jgi:hypothetical protein
MSSLAASLRGALVHGLARELPLVRIRHNDRPVYVAEGYGGRPIDCFPPHRFFRLFVAGEREAAFDGFCAWYREQFARHAGEPKREGGMQGGTLHRLLGDVCREAGAELPADPRAVDRRLLDDAIARRVRQRFGLLEAIEKEGYRPELGKPVLGLRRGAEVMLLGGHHRAAALSVLGREVMPEVAVFPEPAFRALKRLSLV